jgi:hypothetical protein
VLARIAGSFRPGFLVRPTGTFGVFLLAGVLVGLLSLGAGLLVGDGKPAQAKPIECTSFLLEFQRQSSTEVQLTAPIGQAVLLGMDFLDLDGGIMRPQEVELAAGATMMVEFPLGQPVSGIQIVASVPVQIMATVLHCDSAGPWERQPVSCQPASQPISRSVRNREPETP